jgi:hypothetical protein
MIVESIERERKVFKNWTLNFQVPASFIKGELEENFIFGQNSNFKEGSDEFKGNGKDTNRQ